MTMDTDPIKGGADVESASNPSDGTSSTCSEQSDEKKLDRGSWSNQLDFFMSCVGYAVGLGNIWRFPYLCFQNGGGAFLIPYIIMLAIAGLPLFFFEMAFGQFASLGPITIWKVNPLFRGIGFSMILISLFVCVYYNVIVAWGLFYMLASAVSLGSEVPWASCGNAWNTPQCQDDHTRLSFATNASETVKLNTTLGRLNQTCLATRMNSLNLTYDDLTLNFTLKNLTSCKAKVYTPSEEYFERHVLALHEADGLWALGGMNPKLVLMLALAWTVLFFCLKRGVKTSGKVVYFMALFPYVILVALLIRGVTLPGHMQGIMFYIIPEWKRILDVTVWRQAATQIFYSLGPAFGTLITMSSFNKFKHNCYRDAVIVSFINCATSVFAGFVVFSMLGYMAYVTDQDIRQVAKDGPGLVFVVFPEGIARMPGASFWALLFFLMLVALGLDTLFGMFETIISAIVDEFPFLLHRRVLFVMACHLAGFLLGLPLVTKGGVWVLTLMNNYAASYGLMLTCLSELVAVMYVYGIRRFCRDIELMLGFQVNYYWKATWFVITPAAIVLMTILSAIHYSRAYYGDYVFEDYAQGLGWMMVALPIACILIPIPVQWIRYGSFRAATTPTSEWGPALPENRTGPYAPSPESQALAAETEGMAATKTFNPTWDSGIDLPGRLAINMEGTAMTNV